MAKKETEESESFKVSLQDLRDILIIAGIYLFFTGWIYVYYFYDYFGIGLSLVNVDYTTYLVYSFLLKDANIPSQLFLLGQNNEYFFVLVQQPPINDIKALPLGAIYFVDKKNVLYSKIIITSNSNK